jgi:uncharacterized protein (DUF169 family)
MILVKSATSTVTARDLDIDGICRVLDGKIRGKPVAVAMFETEVHPAFAARKVDPCAVLIHARDDDELVHVDRGTHDCSHGAFITGLTDGTELIRTGQLLPVFIKAYTDEAGLAVNSGKYVLPRDTVAAVGAAPLDKIPDDVEFGWIVVVCTPFWASQIAAARSVEDGVAPSAAAGSSFCTDAFVTPWYEENVVLTPGDFGGRMNNKLKPEEMFVIVPVRWAENLIKILGEVPDVRGLFEATREPDSDYWERKAARAERGAAKAAESARSDEDRAVRELAASKNLQPSLDWDLEALQQVVDAPRFVRKFAVGNVEDYANEHGHERVTLDVVKAQMESAGMGKMMKFLSR